MKIHHFLLCISLLAAGCCGNNPGESANDRRSLEQTKTAIRDAFGRGDVAMILLLHHPDIVKDFGGNNVVSGRDALGKGLSELFRTSKVEFLENRIENTVFNGETAIETCVFAIRSTPKNGGSPTIARGRSMVVFVRYSSSPTGWVSIREMVQEAPDK
jgi:ketosteroid isomerase-like protein